MLRRDSERLVETVESLADSAPDHPVSRGVFGAIVPAILALHGVRGLWRGRMPFVGGRPLRWLELHGAEALCLAAATLAAAAFLHAHFFWTPHPRFHGYGTLGKIAALIAFAAAAGGFVWFGLITN